MISEPRVRKDDAGGTASRLRLLCVVVAATAALVFLSGCQTWTRDARPANLPSSAERLRTTTDYVEAPELELPVESASDVDFLLRRADTSDPLPDIRLRNVSVTESGLYDAMNLIAASANLSLSIEGGARALERYGATAVFRLSGTLTDVIEQMSEGMGFFYSVRNRMLIITPEQQFILQTPPALTEDNLAGFANNLQVLGARDTYLDRLNSTVAFRANRIALRSIEQYVRQLRAARSMLIYEVQVYQVDLTDDSKSGINWNRLGWTEDNLPSRLVSGGDGGGTGGGSTGGGGSGPPGSDVFSPLGSENAAATLTSDSGYGLSAVISGKVFNGAILLNFLRSQGTVRVVSQPRIGLMSGTRGSLQVGQNTSYVAKVGTNIGNNLNQVTVETERLTTGFELTLFGSESDGVIYTDINLSISELLRFNNFQALGTNLTLPQTADRKVRNQVAARPGDVILLGGISIGRDNADVTNAIGGNNKETTLNRSELVIAVRPKVVRFVKRPLGSTAAAAVSVPVVPPAGTPTAAMPVTWVEPAPIGAAAATITSGVAAVGAYRAQLGAFRNGESAARAAWTLLQGTHPGLKDLAPEVTRESFGGQDVWLLRTAPMARDDAQKLCSEVRRAGDACALVRSVPSIPAVSEGGR